MNASHEGHCPRCGAEIPPGSTEKLCPACLLSGALDPAGSAAETLPAGDAPSPFEPSRFPCDFGGYRLLRLLGRGGMGSVYEAERLADGRRVALKMLGQQLDSPELRHRFLREGRLAAGVNHPHTVYIFGSEEINDIPVITMEIAGSGTLQDKLDRRGPLPVTEAVDAILDVISGLEIASSAGVLHRDIKPSNCFVDSDGSVKVGDFGLSVSTLAKSESFVTTLGRILGTPAFASPEQLRGDSLDLRSDIYSVGATLFTLLTNRPPFEGENAVQVVLHAVSQTPQPLSDLRPDVPTGLARAVARCLAKEPGRRYPDYSELRSALLPFSSREPEPASMKVRVSAGWIDYLVAFLPPYVVLMLAVGNEQFHFGTFMERTARAAAPYLAFLAFGFLYFALGEGIWGAGLGKRLKGLRVIRPGGARPGVGRALLRVALPVFSAEAVRFPMLLAAISASTIDQITWPEAVAYSAATFLCPWIPVLLAFRARAQDGFATFWDRASGTRVVVQPTRTFQTAIQPAPTVGTPQEAPRRIGPYQVIRDVLPERWVAATDPVLQRPVWLLRRDSGQLSPVRQSLSRQGRLRWLQQVKASDSTWDAFEAIPGDPLASFLRTGEKMRWSILRRWLQDLAAELWQAAADGTLPPDVSFDHVWIATRGHAVLLDEPWPESQKPAERFSVRDITGQQRFLDALASRAEPTSLPLHARPVLQNLKAGKFEKLSFLTGILQDLLRKPAEVSRGIRAGSMFLIPFYVWITLFVGIYAGEGARQWLDLSSPWHLLEITVLSVLVGCALFQLCEIPFSNTVGQSIFRLVTVDAQGERAGTATLLRRWAIAWLPLLLALAVGALLFQAGSPNAAFWVALVSGTLWIAASALTLLEPSRGLHDRLAGTWVVRQ